jgi:hypothetical protein
MEATMPESPRRVIYPNELDMLSEVLNEVIAAVGPLDKVARKDLAVRLTWLLLRQFNAGVTDRHQLKSTIQRAATRPLN